jgi:signal transduction histidine kinase
MVPARIPENENKRLQDLYNSRLLDSPQESEFDEIVQFASALCNTPISLISLVDANRQWFKAKVGINLNETNREISFCAHAILEDQLLEIQDATQDDRFSDNPMVLNDPSIRFYAGMPLVTSSGSRLGTLCVIDKIPGHLTEQQKFGLKVLANNVIKIAELRIKNTELRYMIDAQKSIIAVLAHDVRNPLASIKNIIELKQSEFLDAEESAEMLGVVAGQLDSTINMVENVVKWGQLHLQFGSLQFTDFNLCELVDRIFGSESLNSVIKNNQLVNLVNPDIFIYSDENVLEFVIRNLTGNANKFTQSGTIKVAAKQWGIKTTLLISDTGVGMTGDQIAELLTTNKSNTTLGTNMEKGSGLGMLLVKEFIDRMNGTLSVESAVNEGTTFKIVL